MAQDLDAVHLVTVCTIWVGCNETLHRDNSLAAFILHWPVPQFFCHWWQQYCCLNCINPMKSQLKGIWQCVLSQGDEACELTSGLHAWSHELLQQPVSVVGQHASHDTDRSAAYGMLPHCLSELCALTLNFAELCMGGTIHMCKDHVNTVHCCYADRINRSSLTEPLSAIYT